MDITLIGASWLHLYSFEVSWYGNIPWIDDILETKQGHGNAVNELWPLYFWGHSLVVGNVHKNISLLIHSLHNNNNKASFVSV